MRSKRRWRWGWETRDGFDARADLRQQLRQLGIFRPQDALELAADALGEGGAGGVGEDRDGERSTLDAGSENEVAVGRIVADVHELGLPVASS